MARCYYCGEDFPRGVVRFTRDCHGIPFQPACPACYEESMKNGYDGFYYTQEEISEAIEPEDY